MANGFYKDFDLECRLSRPVDKHRTLFQIDRDRILYSSAFRRLQAKTSVFRPGEYDFYRTRLTHTIEVTQIGRSICNLLLSSNRFGPEFHIDPDLVESICLAHDIGHPPFGHAGERTLNALMKNYGGFEANAQTLRLLTEIIWRDPETNAPIGINPTRALVDGILKYKNVRSADAREKFIYADQQKYLDFAFPGYRCVEQAWLSIECRIMDWADETAYSIGDVVDGIKARLITAKGINARESKYQNSLLTEEIAKAIDKDAIDKFAAYKIGKFIEGCSVVESADATPASVTNRHRFKLKIEPDQQREQQCMSQISRDLVFDSPEVQQLEYKADKMLTALFTALANTYVTSANSKWHLLKPEIEQSFKRADDESSKARILCDYISGMSDEYAVRTYRRLFEAEFGSILDRV